MDPKLKGRKLVENLLNAPDGKITRKQAFNFAKLTASKIIEAIQNTVSHCDLNVLDRSECSMDVEFWQEVCDWLDDEIDSVAIVDTGCPNCKSVTLRKPYTDYMSCIACDWNSRDEGEVDYPDPTRYSSKEFVYSYLGDFDNWLSNVSESGFDVVQVLSTIQEPDFGVTNNVRTTVLFKWRVV